MVVQFDGCALQYANAVPETKKHAKASIFGYLGRDAARRAGSICLLFNQSFLAAQYLGNYPIFRLAHNGR